MTEAETPIYQRPVELLQQLVRFDTSHRNEAECIAYIDGLLASAGIETTILAQDPARPNLLARLAGRGAAPPLLLYAHIDVVSTEDQIWRYPPFEGRIADGCVWGRGVVDDKGGAAMSLCAFLRANAEGFVPPGDVVLAMLCDEETNAQFGAKYLVERHPEQLAGIRYAIGETGGFTFYLGGHKFYPIMVAEKRGCAIAATVRGASLHPATAVVRGGAAAKLGTLLTRLDKAHLPVHVIPPVRQMLETMASSVPFPSSLILRQLLSPALTDRVLDLLGRRGDAIYPVLHNTVNVKAVYGGEESGPTPAKLTARLTSYLLPGYHPEDLLAELRPVVGDEVELDIIGVGEAAPDEPDMGLYNTLAEILREGDPQGTPVPLVLTSPTDARIFNALGIQTYGFQPMKLPPDLDISKLAHGANERIPLEALEFGTTAIYQALQRFGQ